LPKNSVFIGEVGLTGEVRETALIEKRIIEASRQGYKDIYIPRTRKLYKGRGLKVIGIANLRELERMIGN